MELIWGLIGFASGGFFGVFGMAILSGRAYDKGKADGRPESYRKGYAVGYLDGVGDMSLADGLADKVVFTSKTDNEGD